MALLSAGGLTLVLGAGCGSESRSSVPTSPAGTDGGASVAAEGGAFDPNIPPSSGVDAGCLGGAPPNKATDITIDPAYASKYTAFDLGAIPGLPLAKYGGLVLSAGDENTLFIGGAANEAGAGIYAVTLVRSACKHIVGFSGTAKKIANAPYIDGGLVYGGGGTLMFTAWPSDEMVRQNTSGMIGFLPPGAQSPTKTINGTNFAMPEALAALGFVPKGFPGEGKLKLVTWEGGNWYDATLALDGSGRPTDVTSATQKMTVPGGPEGFAYVPQGSPLFTAPSMVLSEWSKNAVATYEITGDGDPSLATRKTFLTGLSGAEGAFFDPATGDFLFSTWNLNKPERLVVVLGFVPFDAPK
ncbi:MAG: hypothetical protein U0235_08910 [Polyangiaceae bacterium]